MKSVFALVVTSLILAGCGGPNPLVGQPMPGSDAPAGFWWGVWDGMTILFAAISALFGGNYTLYEVHNTGGWYDFGYIVGIIIFAAAVSSADD